MRAGTLRHHLQFLRLEQTQDATSGVVTDAWVAFQESMGRVEPLSVREFVAAGGKAASISARIVTRHVTGLLPSMRVLVDGDVTYKIEGVLPDPRSGVEHVTLAVSVVAYG